MVNSIAEKSRRRIVRMVLLMFWLLIFEGSIRKWVAPQFSAYLYFLRDPFVIVTYVLAIRAGVFSPMSPWMTAGLCIAAVAVILSVFNLVAGNSQYTPILATYGFRNYFLYLPLAFVIARCFRLRDVSLLASCSIVALLIATPIAVLQFEASPTSVLNVGSATDADLQFKNLASGSGKVRPAGTFTSVMGMTQLTVGTVALLIWAWSSRRRPRPVNPWLVRLGLVAVAVSLAVSGSRTTFVHSSLVIGAAMAMAPLLPGMGNKFKSFLLPGLAVVVFALLFPVLFPEAAQTFFDRWNNAALSEGAQFQLGWIGRAFYGFYDFFRLFGQMPLFGYGIGTAGNGAVNMGVSFNGVSVLRIAEEDWSRHVVELGPVLALVFILFRASFGIWLGLQAFRATLRSGELLPIVLFVYCGVALIHGQITGHGLVNGFGWLYVGACMAACSAVTESVQRQDEAADTDGDELRHPASPFPNLMQ
jgi:hypothetical protein